MIVVINPNSTEAITRGLDEAVAPLRAVAEIRCVTLAAGPPGIETDAHIRAVEAPLVERVRAEPDATAFVIACFSDPGLAAARAATPKPVLGIARAGLMTARTLAERIGVISILEQSLRRHRQLYEQLSLDCAVAGDRAIGMHVTELADHPEASSRLDEVGRALVADGAGAIVLGCTGMAGYRGRLERSLGVPVVDPTVAAVAMGIGAVRATGRS